MCKPVLLEELDVEAVEGVGRDRGVAAVLEGVLAVPEDDISYCFGIVVIVVWWCVISGCLQSLW